MTICLLEVFISGLAFIYCVLALFWEGFVDMSTEEVVLVQEQLQQDPFSQELNHYAQQQDSPLEQPFLQHDSLQEQTYPMGKKFTISRFIILSFECNNILFPFTSEPEQTFPSEQDQSFPEQVHEFTRDQQLPFPQDHEPFNPRQQQPEQFPLQEQPFPLREQNHFPPDHESFPHETVFPQQQQHFPPPQQQQQQQFNPHQQVC